MAEAVVDSPPASRYFCHHCTEETNPVLPEFICSRCRTGFIEEVIGNPQNDGNSDYLDESMFFAGDDSNYDPNYAGNEHNLSDILSHLYGQLTPHGADSSDRSVLTDQRQSSSDRSRRGGGGNSFHVRLPSDAVNDQTLEGIFHILSNAGRRQGSGPMGNSGRGRAGFINIDLPVPFFQVLHGNPEDYAWGSGGLDTIITQLLNQLDGAGPPPMPKDQIDGLPDVKIVQEQVDKNLQCTVCMEDYKLGEKVKQIPCSHVFHHGCIIPWLEMHGTCPICRKILNSNQANGENTSMEFQQSSGAGRAPDSASNEEQSSRTNTNISRSNNPSNYEFSEDYD